VRNNGGRVGKRGNRNGDRVTNPLGEGGEGKEREKKECEKGPVGGEEQFKMGDDAVLMLKEYVHHLGVHGKVEKKRH